MAYIDSKAEIISSAVASRFPIRAITKTLYLKMIQVAESYSATTASDWTSLDGVSAAPTTQDSALDVVATALKNLQANDPDTIITAQGDLIVGDASAEGAPLAIGSAGQMLLVNAGATAPAYVSMSGDATISSTGVVSLSSGVIVNDDIAAGTVDADKMNKASLHMLFASPVLHVDDATTPVVPTGTSGNVNWVIAPEAHLTHTVIGTQTDVSLAWTEADRLEITQDTDDNDGCELNLGITSNSQYAFTVGTDNPYIEARFEVADVSGHDEIIVGFRKAEAHQADYNNYDEAVFMNIDAGAIKVGNILNAGATVETDTTDAITDGQFAKLRVEVDDVQGLASAITLANALKATYTAHIADATEHGTAADATNVITAADATDLATLLTLVGDMLTQYDAHEGDSELGAAWLYHNAQEAGDVSLASAVAPTDLGEAFARLNDLKAKFNSHDADATAHTAGSAHQESTVDSSRCFFTLGANTTTLSAPSTTDQFYLDDDEVIVPFIRVLNETAGGKVYLQELKIGSV